MAEVLGQRSLLGFGVLLAWLMLFHLLVNIWLLCVFTSLLVVLGGWFGSQAILESNNMLHLERFITLDLVQPSMEDEKLLDQEIHNTVRKIIRDFVTSWYSTVSSESSFEMEAQEAMICMAMELKLRARQVDRKELTQRILDLFGSHLQDYIRAKELVHEQQTFVTANGSSESKQLWRAYSSITTPHLAMTSDTVELNYVRAVVDLLLHVLVPSPHLETRTGRFVVGELITCNVFFPLIAKLSDPDWLNHLVIQIFRKSSNVQETSTTGIETSCPKFPAPPAESEVVPVQHLTQVPQKNSDVPPQRSDSEPHNDTETTMPELAAYDVIDSVEFSQSNAEDDEPSQPFLKRYIRGSKLNPFYQENDSDPDSPLGDYKRSSTDSLVMIDQDEGLYDRQKESGTSVDTNNGEELGDFGPRSADGPCLKVMVNSEPVAHPNCCELSSVMTAVEHSAIGGLQALGREDTYATENPNKDLLSVEQSAICNPNELSPLQGCSSLPTFSFEPPSSPEGPVIIQNLRITGTITAKEHRGTGSHPYTLYTIKYETAMGCENPGNIQLSLEDAEAAPTGCENPSSAQPVAYHTVNRRYSEFLNLQTRLEEKPELRKLIKGVKGPKKIFPDMPFGNMDSDKIEARKGLLETFLKQLCVIPEIANSEEMQEFLALNTDARIAFVKKPFIVSRIDKARLLDPEDAVLIVKYGLVSWFQTWFVMPYMFVQIVVNAIVDTLKTAFPRSEPQSPTEDNESEVDGLKLPADKKSKSRLKFSSKNIPFMNGSDVRPPVLFSSDQINTVFKGMSLEDLQTFITEQEKLSMRAEAECEASPVLRPSGGSPSDEASLKQNPEHACEMGLAEVALNILCLLMKEQWSWLCTENIQRAIRLLFGTLINRWLDVGIANLTCTRYWVVYLQVIQEAVWPGGSLSTAPYLECSQQQKDRTKQQALQCLMKLVPELVSDMLDSDKYKLCWQTVLDSFQDPYINRHLVYCIFDLLLEFLVPEIPDENFQRNLLQSLCKNPEKQLA
ncbi:LOW QUALITY PROTEIN: sorting nexin-19 [Pholidichthys leucotaenia]